MCTFNKLLEKDYPRSGRDYYGDSSSTTKESSFTKPYSRENDYRPPPSRQFYERAYSPRGSYPMKGPGYRPYGRGKYDYHRNYDSGYRPPYDSEYRGRPYERYDREKYRENRDYYKDRSYDEYKDRDVREREEYYRDRSRSRSPVRNYYSPRRSSLSPRRSLSPRSPRSPRKSPSPRRSSLSPRRSPSDRDRYYSDSPYSDDRDKEPGEHSSSKSPTNDSSTRDEKQLVSEPEQSRKPDPVKEEPVQPTPKKRLGFGQGLVAFEKAKLGPESTVDEGLSSAPVSRSASLDSDLITTLEDVKTETPDIKPKLTIEIPPQTPEVKPQPIAVTPQQPQPVQSVPTPTPTPPPVEEEISNISPNFPTKEEVLLTIEKVDSEISKIELQIHNLKKPKKPEHKHSKGLNLVQRLYEENKEKIQQSHEELSGLIPASQQSCISSYKKPSDLPLYKENLEINQKMRAKIVGVLSERKKEVNEKQKRLEERYKKLFESWRKKLEKIETKRIKDEERKKTKEQQRQNSLSARRPLLRSNVRSTTPRRDTVRSDAELDQIINQLREEDEAHDQNKYLKTLAEIPPMILETHRPPVYINKNGFVEDPLAAERERKQLNPWTDEERAIFVKKFVIYPKNFSKIATFLENKSTADVIGFYYTNKKTLDLKKALRDAQNASKKRSYSRKSGYQGPPNASREVKELHASNSNFLASRPSILNVGPKEKEKEKPEKPQKEKVTPKAEKAAPKPEKTPEPEKRTIAQWTTDEKAQFLKYVAQYGRNWKKIATLIPTKTVSQVRNFFQNYKHKLKLNELVEQAEEPKKRGRKKDKVSQALH
jgi:hypothetical protein